MAGDLRQFAQRAPDAEIRLGAIGRSCAGKTALFNAFCFSVTQENLPAGLYFDKDTPGDVVKVIANRNQTTDWLRECPLYRTRMMNESEFFVFEGITRRICLRLQEVIGGILVRPSSYPEDSKKYSAWLHMADVIWVVLPCPDLNLPNTGLGGFREDQALAVAWLREAIGRKRNGAPCSVALVISKIDAAYQTEPHARSGLTRQSLLPMLQPLVNTLVNTTCVRRASVFPVSAFGFGSARRIPVVDDDLHWRDVRNWILREDIEPKPSNVAALVLWSVICALDHCSRQPHRKRSPLAHIRKSLTGHLRAVRPFRFQIKNCA